MSLECVAKADGFRIVTVSSEGDLWLVGEHEWQVVSPGFQERRFSSYIESSIRSATALDNREIAYVDQQNRVFVQREQQNTELQIDSRLGQIGGICHSLSREGGELIGRGIFRLHRDRWWSSEHRDESFDLIGGSSGCQSDDGSMWLQNKDGERLKFSNQRFVEMAPKHDDENEAALIVRNEIVSLSNGQLFRNGRLQEFIEGDVGIFGGNRQTLLTLVEGTLYAVDEDIRAFSLPDTNVRSIHAFDSGGFWLEYENRICTARIRPSIVVRGVLQGDTLFVGKQDIEIISDEDIEVFHGETQLVDTNSKYELDLSIAGRHEIRITSENQERRISFDVVQPNKISWHRDIEPIFKRSCNGPLCHASGRENKDVADLSSYESWKSYADAIDNRVLKIGDMPKYELRDEWTAVDALTIADWLKEGMQR